MTWLVALLSVTQGGSHSAQCGSVVVLNLAVCECVFLLSVAEREALQLSCVCLHTSFALHCGPGHWDGIGVLRLGSGTRDQEPHILLWRVGDGGH